MNDCVEYPMMQIRPYGLVAYSRREYAYPRAYKERADHLAKYNTIDIPDLSKTSDSEQDDNRNSEFYTGKLTAYAKKTLTRAINLLIASAEEKTTISVKTKKQFKFKVNFITLTLPAAQKNVTDKELKKYALDNWIKRMKRKYDLNNYVWRAERQKNGNIHFHLLTDTFIRYDHIRDDWNSILARWHFIDDFKSKHGHTNPNSTDVHSVLKVKNLAAYISKYMSKKEKEQDEIEGKIWDCSKALKTKKNCEMLMEAEEEETWSKALEDKTSKVIHDENYSIIIIHPDKLANLLSKNQLKKWQSYLNEIRTGAT